jgi:hypothetical protein
MKPNAIPVREAARLKGVTRGGLYHAIRTGKVNTAEVGGYTLVLCDRAFRDYTPNPKLAGPRQPKA